MLHAIHAIYDIHCAMHNVACLYLWFEYMALALTRPSFPKYVFEMDPYQHFYCYKRTLLYL